MSPSLLFALLALAIQKTGPMAPGKALTPTLSAGEPDFPGSDVVTLNPGPGVLVDVMKCQRCGWSVTKGDE